MDEQTTYRGKHVYTGLDTKKRRKKNEVSLIPSIVLPSSTCHIFFETEDGQGRLPQVPYLMNMCGLTRSGKLLRSLGRRYFNQKPDKLATLSINQSYMDFSFFQVHRDALKDDLEFGPGLNYTVSYSSIYNSDSNLGM